MEQNCKSECRYFVAGTATVELHKSTLCQIRVGTRVSFADSPDDDQSLPSRVSEESCARKDVHFGELYCLLWYKHIIINFTTAGDGQMLPFWAHRAREARLDLQHRHLEASRRKHRLHTSVL